MRIARVDRGQLWKDSVFDLHRIKGNSTAPARWISVDDTGACQKGRNAVCTQIGNEHFAWFGTTNSKSRLNFLECLRAGYADYVINEQALAWNRQLVER